MSCREIGFHSLILESVVTLGSSKENEAQIDTIKPDKSGVI